ncbi:MAG: glycosyltransferase family 9 protein [Calditrichaeota bacterium]|nr:glycosyltransferase family 9 protein [Calditrichota bacterium]
MGIDEKRILIVRLSSLGDIVLTTLLSRILRKTYPDARLGFLTKAMYRDILDSIEHLDDRYSLALGRHSQKEQIRSLREGGWTTVIDLQNNLRSRSLVNALGVREVYRFHRARVNRLIRIYFPVLRKRISTPKSVALQYLACTSGLGLNDDGLGLELKPTAVAVEQSQYSLMDYHYSIDVLPETRPIVIAPGALHPTKMWLPERWAETLSALHSDGWRSQVIIGSVSDLETAGRIICQISHPILNLCGKMGVADVIAIIASADIFISGDSGPMHIAAAVQAPSVSIFGPTVPEFGFAPFRAPNVIVQTPDLNCRPCASHGSNHCPRRHFRCMKDIPAKTVVNEVRKLASSQVERLKF